jgi:hypothetical protein
MCSRSSRASLFAKEENRFVEAVLVESHRSTFVNSRLLSRFTSGNPNKDWSPSLEFKWLSIGALRLALLPSYH